ncbi:MAG: magnesium transporter CorA family protein [Candidatus Sungbacteria bacterium]|nr:magnesium transporter CorA family protein [Candidatus Sungbacteria bacterium]
MRELKVGNIKWISLLKPDADEIRELGGQFPQIHPLVLEELLTPTIRPRVENYDHHLYMVLHFPRFVPGFEKSIANEIDFILMQDVVITVQYDSIPVLEDFWHECEEEEIAKERYGKTPIHLLYYLLRQFFATAVRELDQIQEEIDLLEEKVFTGQAKEILEDITFLKRDILDFRRALKPQHLTLESLTHQGTVLYGEKSKPFLADLLGEYLKAWNLLETHKETLDALYDTNRQLIAAKTNEVMRVFATLAFITFIPTAVANIYGMNIENLPFVDQANSFWIVLSFMGLATLLVYLALKWRKLI